ncbi:hypothetical protein [Kineococcus terrestris]|uniref:hypothetical protein n=1 Tax=Kineococcus terrestris TaxID=2044856 RepID=UPI0034DB619A
MTPSQTAGRLTAALATITAVWHLTLDPPRLVQGAGGGRAGKPESKLPIDVNAYEARADAARLLGSWCETVADERAVCPRDLGDGSVPHLAAWLGEHVDWLAEHEDVGPAAAVELDEVAARLDRVAHPDRPDAVYIGRCPVGLDVGTPCEARLYWPRGAETITCPRCGVTDGVRGWAARMGTYTDAHLTAVQLATYLSHRFERVIDHDLVRRWASRGVLTRAGHDERRRPVYDVAAAVTACTAHLQTSQRPPRQLAAAVGGTRDHPRVGPSV